MISGGSARLAVGLATAAALAGCVPRSAPPPQPAPPPPRQVQPRPAAPQPTPPPRPDQSTAWQDAPLAPGDWSYSDRQAVFASPGGTLFALRCDAPRQIRIFRAGVPGEAMTIATSFGERTLPGGTSAEQALATLPASDPLFDQIAFSRGRFLVHTTQGGDLVLPSWPEPPRLIEECRG